MGDFAYRISVLAHGRKVARVMDLEYLKNPSPLIKVFTPTLAKISDFGTKLKHNYLYTPDELRTDEKIAAVVAYYFPWGTELAIKPMNVWFEIGDWGGLLGWVDIIPGYKASALLKLWEPELWGPTLARDLKVLAKRFMDEYKLIRCSLSTADPRMKKMAEMMGFVTEANQSCGFRFDGKYFTNYLLRRLAKWNIEEG